MFVKKLKRCYRVRTVMENLVKSRNFKWSFPGREKSWKKLKIWKFVIITCSSEFEFMEFEIMNMFFKERRSKYKPAYALNTLHFQTCSCLYRDFTLVMEIWFKVLEKSWKSMSQTVSEPCTGSRKPSRLQRARLNQPGVSILMTGRPH